MHPGFEIVRIAVRYFTRYPHGTELHRLSQKVTGAVANSARRTVRNSELLLYLPGAIHRVRL